VADPEAMSATVGTLLNDLIDASGRDPGSIGVVATSAALRDRLATDHGLTKDPDGKSTCVGTPHRLKGLEFDTVILAVPDPNPVDVALYIGISRAISELIIVGPQNVGLKLGLPLTATV
jgi:superfamily I DNA/RNA helicase